jgi:cation diffusion facilitator family transporter
MPASEPSTSTRTDDSATLPQEPVKQESLLTVVVALIANALLAAAKTVAGIMTGSASMAAEAAHSWADTGNEIFLLIAERQGKKPRDASHPRGYGRATYVWSLVAAFGLFTAGAVVSLWHGVTELLHGEEGSPSYVTNYVVLAIALALEGSSFFQASRQVHGESQRFGLHPLRFVDQTSNPTLRAVFFEDSAALAGILLAGAGIGLHQLTGNAVWDGIGSIAVGILLGFVAVYLMRRNMQYLIGEGLTDDLRSRVVRRILEHRDIDKVTYLHVEFVGPRRLFVGAAVDLVGDDQEGPLAMRLRGIEDELEGEELIVDAVLTLSRPDEAAIEP